MSVMVLEDVLERLSSVPQDVRRGLELIRSLDASWMSKVRALSKEQAAALEAARRAAAGLPRDGSVDIKAALDNAAALERIETLRSEATALADEKVLLASNLMTLIDAHLRRVKADVSTFESALRASGHLQPGDLVDMMGDTMTLDDVDARGVVRQGTKHRAPSMSGVPSAKRVAIQTQDSFSSPMAASTSARTGGGGGGNGGFGMPDSTPIARASSTGSSGGMGLPSSFKTPGPTRDLSFSDMTSPLAVGSMQSAVGLGHGGGGGSMHMHSMPGVSGGGVMAAGNTPGAASSYNMMRTVGAGGGSTIAGGGGMSSAASMSAMASSLAASMGHKHAIAGGSSSQFGSMSLGHASGMTAGGEMAMEMPGEGEKLYCLCNKPDFGEMVACDDTSCEKEWFHLECVGLKEAPKGAWFCPACKLKPKNKRRAGV